MAINLIQISILAAYLIMLVAIWKTENRTFKLILIIITMAAMLVNPFRFKQEGMAKIERRSTPARTELPDRVEGNKMSFEQHQTNELNKLKNESQRIRKNEKIN